MTTRWYNPGNRWLHQPRRHRAANRPIIGSGLCPLPPEVRVLTGGCGQLGRGGLAPGAELGNRAGGSASGSIQGPGSGTGPESGPGKPGASGGGGGQGGGGTAPPDPAIRARQQNREAARNNPMPIPNAMLNPLYGSSVSPPVSSAPDVPSRSADDYRDPVDDTNDTYQNLLDSLTTDDQLSDRPRRHQRPDRGLVQERGKMAAVRRHTTRRTLQGNHDLTQLREPDGSRNRAPGTRRDSASQQALSPLLGLFDPTADARDCLDGDQGACWWAAMGVFPLGRFGRVLRNTDDLGRGGGSTLRYIQPPKTVPGIPGLKNAKPKNPYSRWRRHAKAMDGSEGEHLRVRPSTW